MTMVTGRVLNAVETVFQNLLRPMDMVYESYGDVRNTVSTALRTHSII